MNTLPFQVLFLVLFLSYCNVCALLNGNRLPTTPSPTSSTVRRNSDTEILHQLLTQEFMELEKTSRTLIQKVAVLESKNINLERELEGQKGKIAVLQQENNNFKQQLSQQATDIASLQKDLKSCVESTNFLTTEIGSLRENATILSLCCANSEQNMSRIEDKVDQVESSMLQQMKNDKLIQNGKIENVSGVVDKLKTQNRYISLTLVDLQSGVLSLNSSLFSAVSNLSGIFSFQLNALHRNVTEYLNSSLSQTNVMVANIQKNELSMVSSLQALNGSYHRFISEYGDKIGFTAMLYANEDVQKGQTVKCTTVKNNFGSRYDANTGIFKSDRSGLFVFFFGVECRNGYVHAELVRDGTQIGDIYCESDREVYVQSAAMAVTVLSTSSAVYVRIVGTPTSQIYGKTTFAGVQIK